MKAIVNVRLYDFERYIENAYVVFDKKIVKVGPMAEFLNENYEIIDGQGKLLLPNFVCSHAHIYSIFARGLALPFHPRNFQEILDQMWWKIDSKIDNEITYYSGISAGSEFIKNGVTTIIDHHASGREIIGSLNALKKALNETLGLRCILCFETSDRYPVADCIKENATFLSSARSETSAGLFGMHASMSLSDDTLEKIGAVLKNNPIHIHVAESEMDEEDSLSKHRLPIINRLEKFHLLNPMSLIVHGVHISNAELDIIAKHRAYMVVNTTSNMNNGVGLPDVSNYLHHGIKVLLGNDGLSSTMANEYQNLLYTAHLKKGTPNAMNLGGIIDIINNAYAYVSEVLKIKLGRIAPGYEADFLLIPYTPFTPMDESNAFGHIFYGLFPGFTPEDVYCRGVCLLKNRQLVNGKLNDLLNDANRVSKRLWKLVKED